MIKNKKELFYLSISILIVFIFLIPNLNSEFLNWDDQEYVVNNPLIKDLSFTGIKNIFKLNQVVATYSPVILISWAIDYSIFGLNPAMFHLANIILHLIIMVLVFYFTKLLCKDVNTAIVVTILFGIHPMHIEAVSWISARKDLLYTLFFFAGLISYYFYTEKQLKYPKYFYYLLCLLFYLLSLLSKGTAVIFPLVLLLLDFFKNRKNVISSLIEKIPFFLLSGVFVYLSIIMQVKGGAMDDRKFVSIIESLSVGFYGYFNYIFKAFIPIDLSVYHPYPYAIGESIPWYFYLTFIPVLALFIWVVINYKKKKNLLFGVLFFFISLIPVIQVLPIGPAITADRYTYLPYFGLFYVFAYYGIQRFNNAKFKKYVLLGFTFYIIILGFITFNYSKTFNNSNTLWSNVIKKYPKDNLAYLNLCDFWIGEQQYVKALSSVNMAIQLKNDNPWSYYNRAIVFKEMKKNDLAFIDLNKAISLDKSFVSSYLNRGILNAEANNFHKAILDFDKVINLSPEKYKAYFNRAMAYKSLKVYDSAIIDLTKVISLKKALPIAYEKRGDIQFLLNKMDMALLDYDQVINYNTKSANAFAKRGFIYYVLGNYKLAKLDYLTAINLNINDPKVYIDLGTIYLKNNHYNEALKYFNMAQKKYPDNYFVYYNRGILQMKLNNYEIAIEEFDLCLKINPNFTLAKKKREKSLESIKYQFN